MTPSPMAQVIRPDVKAWATRHPAPARDAHRAAVSAHAQAVAAGHPSALPPVRPVYDRQDEVTILLAHSPEDVRRIRELLQSTATVADAAIDLSIHRQLHAPTVHATDATRPGGAS